MFVDPPSKQTHPMDTRSQHAIFKNKLFSCTKESLLHEEPRTVSQALSSIPWKTSMTEEYQALFKNKTWHSVPLRRNMNIVGNKCVFKLKRHSYGTVSRHKACLVG